MNKTHLYLGVGVSVATALAAQDGTGTPDGILNSIQSGRMVIR